MLKVNGDDKDITAVDNLDAAIQVTTAWVGSSDVCKNEQQAAKFLETMFERISKLRAGKS